MQCKPNDFWYTPPLILDAVEEFLDVNYFDPCPIDPQFDGLKENWGHDCYINPPYSKELKRAFINKALEEFEGQGNYIWLLNYANTKDLQIVKSSATAICLPHKRVKFIPGHPGLKESSPRHDNIILLWGSPYGFGEAFSKIGNIYYAS